MIAASRLLIGQALDGACPHAFSGVARDSRQTAPGQLYVACGAEGERAAHIAQARARGAAAVVGDDPGCDLASAHPRWAFARASCAAAACDRLPFPVVAVTGTKGKSTTVHFAWWAMGPGAARIGTVGWHDGRGERPNDQTTPPPDALHAFIAGLPAACPGVALEASSHGADQHRLAGLPLAGLAYTGLGRDHHDYHGGEAAYLSAKLRLARLVVPGGLGLVNGRDRHAPAFAHALRAAGARVLALDLHAPGLLPAGAVVRRAAAGWELALDGRALPLPVALPGGFNAWNAAAGALLAHAAGAPLEAACARLAGAPPVPGRLERLAESPLTYVDYAHTPESIANAIAALREAHPGARLAIAFGCGGDRDPGKRAPMGAAAAAADAVVITTDNCRSEDPAAIAAAVVAGVRGAVAEVELDRGAAILRARALAGPAGVVLVAGKGHETTQSIRGQVLAWDDRAFVRSLGTLA